MDKWVLGSLVPKSKVGFPVIFGNKKFLLPQNNAQGGPQY